MTGIFSAKRSGDVYGWKKVFAGRKGSPSDPCSFAVVAKLIIPKDAGIVYTFSKCRASRAIVDGFYACDPPDPDDELSLLTAHSSRDSSFLYIDGSEVCPDYFDDDITVTCSHGIHFFRTYEEAANYDFM